jgi:hypothetical protein
MSQHETDAMWWEAFVDAIAAIETPERPAALSSIAALAVPMYPEDLAQECLEVLDALAKANHIAEVEPGHWRLL